MAGWQTYHTDVKLLVSDLITLPPRGNDYFGKRARELSKALVKTHIATVAPSTTRDAISLAAFYELVNMVSIPSGWTSLMARMEAMPDGDIQRAAAEMDDKRKSAPKNTGPSSGA